MSGFRYLFNNNLNVHHICVGSDITPTMATRNAAIYIAGNWGT